MHHSYQGTYISICNVLEVSLISVMAALRPVSGLLSKRLKCTSGSLIRVMAACRPVSGLHSKRLKFGTALFWKRKFAELIGTRARVAADKKD